MSETRALHSCCERVSGLGAQRRQRRRRRAGAHAHASPALVYCIARSPDCPTAIPCTLITLQQADALQPADRRTSHTEWTRPRTPACRACMRGVTRSRQGGRARNEAPWMRDRVSAKTGDCSTPPTVLQMPLQTPLEARTHTDMLPSGALDMAGSPRCSGDGVVGGRPRARLPTARLASLAPSEAATHPMRHAPMHLQRLSSPPAGRPCTSCSRRARAQR